MTLEVLPAETVVARGKRPPQGEPVVDRALALLAAFDDKHLRLSLSDLARRSGMPVSTARRLAVRFVAWGALEKDESGLYSVGLRLWQVASLAERGLSLRDEAPPFLDDLHAVTHHHVQLAVLDHTDALVLDRRLGDVELPAISYRVGGRIPLVASAAGVVLLAHSPAEFQDQVLSGPFRWPLHECPRPAAKDVRAQLAGVRRTGLAMLSRPTAPIASVAAPVRDQQGSVVAAISVVVPAGSIELYRFEPALRATARAVSRAMGAPMAVGATAPW